MDYEAPQFENEIFVNNALSHYLKKIEKGRYFMQKDEGIVIKHNELIE